MNQGNLIKQILDRFASENPKFWKIISAFGLIGFLLVGAVLLLDRFEILILKDNIQNFLEYLSISLGTMFATANLSTTDAKLVDEKTFKNVAEKVLDK